MERKERNRMNKRIAVLGLAAGFVLAGAVLAEEWKNVSLVDSMCAEKDAVKADPDKHPAKCAMACAKNGYGIMADGKFLKFDDAGNKQAAAALQATKKTDHLRATVVGERKGDQIAVQKITMD
jgi:hypothetical protein